MATEFAVRVENQGVLQVLQRLSSRLDDLTPFMEEVSGVLAFGVEEAFRLEQDPVSGAAWEELADATVAQRSADGHWPGKMLQVTGQLAASFSTDFGPDFAMVGTNLEYAAIHQFGGKAGRNRSVDIPARPYLGLSDDSAAEILVIAERYLAED
jgi:phage virion morphogenesis protein